MLTNCKKCGKLFDYCFGAPVCQACKDSAEEDFKKTKEYIWGHRGASVEEVSRECEVSVSRINRWIREGRLELADDSPLKIPCEMCGAPISSGRLCPKCSLNFESEVGRYVRSPQSAQGAAPKNSTKMRFFK